MGRKRRNNVYRHFMLQEESQTSICLLCYKTLNSTHGSNLMNHLKFMHKLEYQQILALNMGGAIPPLATPPVHSNDDDDDSNQSDADLEVDVDKFFNVERGANRARCEVCQASVEIKRNSMMKHLKQEHPRMLKPANDESEEEEDENENLYQEVVYLYDSDSKSVNNFRPHKTESSTPISSQKPKLKKKMRQTNTQSISVESRKRRRTLETISSPVERLNEELDNFGKYVTCLMKTVPKDLCTQLQMEIINLIMKAKIKKMSLHASSTSLVVEKLDSVSAEPFNQIVMGTAEANKDSAPPSPESNVGDMPKIECN